MVFCRDTKRNPGVLGLTDAHCEFVWSGLLLGCFCFSCLHVLHFKLASVNEVQHLRPVPQLLKTELGSLKHAELGTPTIDSLPYADQMRLLRGTIWVWLKIQQEGQTAGVGPCFHIPGFQLGIPVFRASAISKWI